MSASARILDDDELDVGPKIGLGTNGEMHNFRVPPIVVQFDR